MKPLAPNSMIQNRYLVVQMIGKGGMGEVYLAVDQRLGSAVALKRTFFHDNNALGSAFEREARILARLRHPVLPKVIDHFSENGDQFLVMEHISGDDLAKRLENATEPFPVSWVMFWADQMLDALSYMHSHEPPIVHRDIKPQNLKLTDENHIVLLDFGLSKDFNSSTTGSLNSASVAGYSPHFASMEQIRGTGTDARSDLYSLSATLYQLLTNTVPADALTRADALLGGAKDPIVPLNEINPAISAEISEVILKGVELRQDKRFSSAAEMQKALRRAFKQSKEDVEAKPIEGQPKFRSPLAAPQTNPSEMATRAQDQADSLHTSMDVTIQDNSAAARVMQSAVKTEVLPSREDGVVATRVSEDPKVAATAGANAASAPKKKSSKAGLLISGVVGLLLLVGVSVGGGWFYFSKYYKADQIKVVPTPVVAAPSPSPTMNVAAEIDQRTITNSNTVIPESTVSSVDSSEPRLTTSSAGPAKPPPATTKNNPPRSTTQPPAAKATPKAKARDDRTVILQ
jgi:serine/threonine protein kinase